MPMGVRPGAPRMSINPPRPTVTVPQPNLNQMPPSSAHQANVGIPGGLNPRDSITFQGLQGAQYNSGNARYPNPNATSSGPTSMAPNPVGGVGIASGGPLPVPPMPPVVATTSMKTTAESAVSDIKAVLSTPLTTAPSIGEVF